MAIATADKNFGRQYVLCATQDINFADLAHGEAHAVLDVRPGTRIIGGGFLITTAFNGTTPSLDIGDGTDPDRYSATPVDADAVAGTYTALDVTGYKYVESDTIDVTLTGADTTEGAGTLFVQYIIDGRVNENEPNYN